jgi:hypothetical protein
MEFVVSRQGTGHGLALGFDRFLGEGIEMSNAPDCPDNIRLTLISEPVFFPWAEPVALEPRDVVSVEIDGVLVGEDYVWSWNTEVYTAGGEHKAAFKQSTFHGTPLSLSTLKKRAPDYLPSLTDEGRVMLLVLNGAAERQPAGAIARRLVDVFPDRFTRVEDALAFVGGLLAQFG